MDRTSPNLDSDNESDTDVLVLDTDYDFPVIEDRSPTTVNQNIGSVWRDMVVGEQMQGCLTRLEVTTKTNCYIDIDDPNYIPIYNEQKRKRTFSSTKPGQRSKSGIENEEFDQEFNHVDKKRHSYGNGNFNKCNYKYGNKKELVEKRNNSDNKTKGRMLPDIIDSDEKTFDQLLDELCINLHEQNKILMLSVISKIDRKIILEKYNKTCLIEANGGQMIKNGNRRRTSGGIFFNLIKEDKSIPNSAKKDLFGSSLNEEIKKKKKREKIKRKKEKLKKMIAQDRKEADMKKLNKELTKQPSNDTIQNDQLSDLSMLNDIKIISL